MEDITIVCMVYKPTNITVGGTTLYVGNWTDQNLCWTSHDRLVGGLEHLDYFFRIFRIISPTDELHHFSEG